MRRTPGLVVLAAGMGSRYGSLKQIDQFGPSGQTILDYSIYDAMQAGFRKIIFVIRQSIEEEFKSRITAKFPDQLQINYVYQELDKLPDGYLVPQERVKPWGTAHAVLVAREVIQEPLAVINADDFYGKLSYKILFNFLSGLGKNDKQCCIIGYQVRKTLSDFGPVSRAICKIDENGWLKEIVERKKLFKSSNGVKSQDEKGTIHIVDDLATVSMNMMGFTPSVFQIMESYFKEFLKKNINILEAEFSLPTFLNHLIKNRTSRVKILPTDEDWFGVTYKQDKPVVKNKLLELLKKGKYPEDLWR